mmetsp:Transcript_35522/g.95340  ORF Transcript_35522/g.95340 Transcript_35522/m.95340 type:complete len:633 (-) Transcript_35522:611-2509(-)
MLRVILALALALVVDGFAPLSLRSGGRRSLSPPALARPVVFGGGAARRRSAAVSMEVVGEAAGGRPLKVAIAGGGVGGLTTALCMLKAGFDVTIYEKTSAFARFGGPIQFASNALSTLKAIDEGLFERVMTNFTFTGTRACGIKDGLRADGTFSMAGSNPWTAMNPKYLVDPEAPADWFVRFPLKACADLFGLPYTGVINRPDLQETLIDECVKLKPDFIQNGNPVDGYENLGDGLGVSIKLADGTTETADVLVGSDGIWSSVRAQMYGEEIKGTSPDKMKRQGCSYSGYTVFAGETVLKTADYYETGYKVYIGPKRYFVTSDVGNGRVQWYAFFALPPGTKRAPSGWGGSTRTEAEEDDLVGYIKSLHEGWTDEVHYVLDNTPESSVEQRDLYDRVPELLRSWSDGSVTLIGDAVHPMMPNLGQGGCQAIEDAYVLTEVLKGVNDTAAVPEALSSFYRKRIVRTTIIQFLSRLASDLIINAFDTPWSPHDQKGTNWKSYLTFAWKPLLQYVIFPAQFAYLYSYYPSGSMGDLPAELDAKWKKKVRLRVRVPIDGRHQPSPVLKQQMRNLPLRPTRYCHDTFSISRIRSGPSHRWAPERTRTSGRASSTPRPKRRRSPPSPRALGRGCKGVL